MTDTVATVGSPEHLLALKPPLGTDVRLRLSVMMFLEFFIWGAWLPLIFGYLPGLKFSAMEQSWILNAFAIASFTGMFFSNQFADRNFAAERFLAVSHLIGGVAMLVLPFVTSFWPFFLAMLVHSLFYVPTISITNSIAFANLKDPRKDFGRVRLWGTIGWIAASWPFVFILVDWAHVPAFGSVPFGQWLGNALGMSKSGSALQQATTYTFMASGIASLALSGFSLLLPHTPPRPAVAGSEKFAWLEAIKLLKLPFLLVLFVVTFFDAAVHQCYFIWTNDFLKDVGIPANWVMPAMSVGQIAEIGTMAILGLFLKRLGWRWTMVIGILGHAIRFGIFATVPPPWLAVGVNILHGICYAFFFATVYIFVDEFFPKDARSSAQGLFNFLILGFGPFIANFVWPTVGAHFTEAVDIVRPAANVVLVKNEYRNITVHGMAAPDQELSLKLSDGKSDTPVEAHVTADKDGKWSLPTQFLSRSEMNYSITTSAGGITASSPRVTEVDHVNFHKLFLVPAGTGLFAALLLVALFHPPKTGKKDETAAI